MTMMEIELVYDLLNSYQQAKDKIIRNNLGIALRRAVELLIAESEDNRLVTDEEILTGLNTSKVAAVKMYRTRTGVNLKEAKEAIESHFDKNGLEFHKWDVFNYHNL